MRGPVELCFAAVTIGLGIVLFLSSPSSGMSPLSRLEAGTVIGGQTSGGSGCEQGELLTAEEPPGTGCDSSCVRVPNVYSKGESGSQVPQFVDCPNNCGRFSIGVAPCGS